MMLIFTIRWRKHNKTRNHAILNKLLIVMDYSNLQRCQLLCRILAVLQPADHILINLVGKVQSKKERHYFRIGVITNLKLS